MKSHQILTGIFILHATVLEELGNPARIQFGLACLVQVFHRG
jgi:hypothetical protein